MGEYIMSAPKGNSFWKARSTHGRNPIFKTSKTLWGACCEYFEWVEANPLLEERVFHTNGIITHANVSKMRAMTKSALCIFLDICDNTWENYKKKDDFLRIIRQVEDIIYNQKFSGASADLLNANIIARDLGLRDNSKTEHTGADGGPIVTITTEMSAKQASDIYNHNIKRKK